MKKKVNIISIPEKKAYVFGEILSWVISIISSYLCASILAKFNVIEENAGVFNLASYLIQILFIIYLILMFVIIAIGTFNSWVALNFLNEGRRWNEQEGFFNSISSNNYLPFTILTIYSINIKEIHLTQLWFRWNQSNWQHSTLQY